MRSGPEPRTATHHQGNGSSLNKGSPADDDLEPAQSTLETYAAELSTTARRTGEERARRGDPDCYDAAIEAIRRASAEHLEFTSDDLAFRGPAVGAAFRSLRSAGEIETVGDIRTSKRAQAHGRWLLVWRAA